MDVVTFSTREIAIALWWGFALTWLLTHSIVRGSLSRVIRSLLAPVFLKLGAVVLVATAASVWILYAGGFWNIGLLKETVYWFLFSALVIAGRSLSKTTDGSFLQAYVEDHIQIIVVLEALIAAHTFSLPVELVLVPLVTVLAMMQAIAQSRDELRPAEATVTVLLAGLAVGVLSSTAWNVVQNPGGLMDGSLASRALLPVILSAMFMPTAFLLSLYSGYENLFIPLRIGPEKPLELQRRARWALVRRLGVRRHLVWQAARNWRGPLMRLRSEQELRDLLESDPTVKRIRATD